MRKFIFFLLAVLSFSSSTNAATDTSAIIHKMDGVPDEWPADRFATDKETGIRFAVDNDALNLYITMSITDQPEQAKIMEMGMRLFIDLKGKRKQNLGVEFPIQRNNLRSDLDGLRMMLSLDPKMKLFGFTESGSAEQNLVTGGDINIAFGWDSTNAMNIEYLIPLTMLEPEIISLKQKIISIGWKINGVEMPVASATPSSTSLGGLPNNGISRPAGNKPATTTNPAEMENRMKEQFIWTKYIFSF